MLSGKIYRISLLGLVSIFLFSCIDEEGEGGKSVVQGYVYTVYHPDDIYTFETDTFPAAKEDVYIIYGNQPVYGDKMETGYDGFYRFKYLTKGNYKVYAYSNYSDSQKEAVIDSVSVSSNETKDVANIYIHKGKSLDKSYIKGTVLQIYYDKGSSISGFEPAYDTRVYIRVKGATYHFDEVRTSIDGVFMFQNLDAGDYEVFVYTQEVSTEILSPVIQSVTVDQKGIVKTIETPFYIVVNV